MAKYVYPAVLSPEGEMYNVVFPDIEGCYTCGDNLSDALTMAEDVLNFSLVGLEDGKEEIKAPSDMNSIPRKDGEIVTLIMADTDEYRRSISNIAVKKTLTLPSWLNVAAEKQGINFSRVLQEALKKELAIG